MKSSVVIRVLVALAVAAVVAGCVSMGHPNLAAARDYVEQAIAKVSAAQAANNYDMKGHAARAKQLMQQAIEEMNLAAQAADH